MNASSLYDYTELTPYRIHSLPIHWNFKIFPRPAVCAIASNEKFCAYGLLTAICIHCPVQLAMPNFLNSDVQWVIVRVMFSNLQCHFPIIDPHPARLLYVLQEETLNCTWRCRHPKKSIKAAFSMIRSVTGSQISTLI